MLHCEYYQKKDVAGNEVNSNKKTGGTEHEIQNSGSAFCRCADSRYTCRMWQQQESR
ncbi:hypothetical protein RUMOBE_02775 [Blautia obeum ATCC 29174]|uniref:Uncharacterized protein n=1 Tax=Blautia obeum ATCC 29174 TaxID=411459 RepID=A5ZUU0_9FIRM|nr:hypothetical protein RUMOBE_02775 [Blautia obeum ATCC 29174]